MTPQGLAVNVELAARTLADGTDAQTAAAPPVIPPAAAQSPVAAPESFEKKAVGPTDTVATAHDVSAMAAPQSAVAEELVTIDAEIEAALSAIIEEPTVVEEAMILEEGTAVDVPVSPSAATMTSPGVELAPMPRHEEMPVPSPARTAADGVAAEAFAPRHWKRALETVVSRLLARVRAWTSIRR